MDKLIEYIRTEFSSEIERDLFCRNCGTSWGYVKKAASIGQNLRESVCINFERESSRQVKCEDMRPDVDWAFIRSTEAA